MFRRKEGQGQERKGGAAGKTPAFGILKRGEEVFVAIAPNCAKEALTPIIKGLILEKSAVCAGGWKAYGGLVLNGYSRCRAFHRESESTGGKGHADGMESFWSFAEGRLVESNGRPSENSICHPKECEWRCSRRNDGICKLIGKMHDKSHLDWRKIHS